MSGDIGYWFEGEVKKACDHLKEHLDIFYHRFQDSKAAGSFTAGAPADFLIAYKGKSVLLECKASRTHESLRSCLSSAVDDGQLGHHLLWLRSGNQAWFMFYADIYGHVEIWESQAIIDARFNGSPLPKLSKYRYLIGELPGAITALF